ncbi:MAG: Fic family protein [Acidobacteriia bacterium]|nr:Fic family protein [Terriglobia bacterium]
MEKANYEKPIGPWYRNFKYWNKMALDYIYSYKNIPKDERHHAEFNTFSQFMGFRLVFESNLIEGEGLSSGETIKVVKECFPSIPDSYEAMRRLIELQNKNIYDIFNHKNYDDMMKVIEQYGLSKEKILPSIKFAKKSRGYVEVAQHYSAYQQAHIFALKFIANRYMDIFKKLKNIINLKEDKSDEEVKLLDDIIQFLNEASEDEKDLFTEDKIKRLHKIMATGLLPKDAKVGAGEYRIDERMVGDFGIAFPSPELVPECMEKFIGDANSLILSAWKREKNIFEVAALISHEFVRIHPFPDFNGRVSRLILMIVLMANGVPFAVTLRGDKKGRNRYLSSLRKANKHHITPYAALIAMRVSELFREIDENILLAGLPSILSFKS